MSERGRDLTPEEAEAYRDALDKVFPTSPAPAPSTASEPRCPTCSAPLGDHAAGDLKRCGQKPAPPADAGARMSDERAGIVTGFANACSKPWIPEMAAEMNRARVAETRLTNKLNVDSQNFEIECLKAERDALAERVRELGRDMAIANEYLDRRNARVAALEAALREIEPIHRRGNGCDHAPTLCRLLSEARDLAAAALDAGRKEEK
jgi:hypothetical protein